MRNLKVSCIKNAKFNLQVLSYCFDSDNGVTYILNNLFEIYTIAANESNPALFQTVEASGKAISFEYWVEARGILLVLENGQISLIRKELNKLLYKHESRITSVALSPCQDLLALVDENYNIQLMSPSETDFHVIHKLNSLESNESLNKPVGVGWGSKETQFFGLDGRQTQKSVEPEKVLSDEELKECQEIESSDEFIKFKKSQEKTISIDWRGDSQLLATLTYLPDSQKHCLKIWNKRLELQYMSEKLIEIERGLLSYVPDGQFICCAQRRESKVSEVTFFEKNGLVRHGFQLPSLLKNSYIQTMAWSPNSEILALIVKQFVKTDDKICVKNIMLLYTMRNWHYYLKLSCYLEDDCDYGVRWNPNITNQLHLLTTNGHYIEYDICSRVDYCRDLSTVYVIDGNKILITSLEEGVIPPPMFRHKLEYDDLIYKIGTDSSDFTFISILTMTGRVLLTTELGKEMSTFCHPFEDDLCRNFYWKPSEICDKFGTTNYGTSEDISTIQHIVPFFNQNIGATIFGCRIQGSGFELITMEYSYTKGPKYTEIFHEKFDNQHVVGITSFNYDDGTCYLMLKDGSRILVHYPYVEMDTKSQLIPAGDKSSSCTVLDLGYIGNSCISLTKNLCLSVDDNLIAANSCTSFRVTDNFIVYTTTDNLLQFLHRQELENGGAIADDLLYSQPIENGGFLISASEVDSKVVLQMPRGNLETIYPRLFILSRIMSMIKKCDYVEACKLAKRHRVNMNFLVDFIMRQENSNDLTKFIHEVGHEDPSLLCIVLTELDNSDTISGRYGSIIYRIPIYQKMVDDADKFIIEDKVNNFCKIVSQLQSSNLLHPKLQSLVKMEPRQTEEALRIIFDLENEASRQEAIKFMLYFIDIEELFKSSLCTYNTKITLMVAASSNKDPKQYLGFINELETSDEVIELKQYKIDLYVKRYDHAFKNLFEHRVNIEKENSTTDQIARLDEELIELVTSKKLFRIAVRLMEEEEGLKSLKAAIWSSYADYLLQKRHYEESGWAYSKAYTYSNLRKNYDLALISYAFVNNWEKSIAFIARSSVEKLVKIASLEKISKTLFESGQCENGCLVLTGMGSESLDKVVSTLSEHSSWYLAEFVSGENRRQQLMEHMKSATMRHLETFLDDTRKEVINARQRLSRLELIQRKQSEKPKEMVQYISDTVSTVDGSEISSLSQSSQAASRTKSGVTSIKTRCSAKSATNNKKRINLKEGSRYEDLALVVELRLFLSNQVTYQAEASKLISSVFEYCPLDYASSENAKLHRLLSESLEQSKKILEKLWPPVESEGENLSVIKRLERHFLSTGISTTLSSLENVDFQVCIKPDLPKLVTCFDL